MGGHWVAAQTFAWAKSMGGASGEMGNSLAIDDSGNIYSAGYFSGTADFDPSANTYNLISAGNDDIFISKLDASGNFLWAKRVGGGGYDYCYAIAIDNYDNIYLTGYFFGTVDFDPGPGNFYLSSSGTSDVFISKLQSSGNFLWAKRIGGTNSTYATYLATDDSDNVYTTGYFNGTVDFDPGAGIFNMISGGSTDIFISKLDASGNFLWAKKMGGTNMAQGYSIVIGSSFNIFTTGNFAGTVDFDPSPDTFYLTSSGNYDIFILKLDANGNFFWAKGMGGTNGDFVKSIAVDSIHNVYTTGYFDGNADFDPGGNYYYLSSAGSSDIFISKLDSFGNFLWAQTIGGTGYDRGYSIALDASCNLYTTGHFSLIADFNQGPGTNNLTAAGGEDIFILKLESSGNFLWAIRMGGTAIESGQSITIDGSGNVFSIGYFGGTADFDPSAAYYNLISAGQIDIFISKLNNPVTGVAPDEIIPAVSLFPNPSDGNLRITGIEEFTNYELKIYNVFGEKVHSAKIRSAIVKNSMILSTGIIPGLYFLQLKTENSATIYSTKIVIQ